MAGIEGGPGKSQAEPLALALGWSWRVGEVACAREFGTTNNNTTIRALGTQLDGMVGERGQRGLSVLGGTVF